MSTESAAPAPKGGLVPYLMVADASDASELYQSAFGAEEVSRMAAPDSDRLIHVHLYINGSSLMMSDAMPEHGRPLQDPQGYTLTLIVDDIDAWAQRAIDHGVQLTSPIEKMFWGDLYCTLLDPFGVQWAMNEPAKR